MTGLLDQGGIPLIVAFFAIAGVAVFLARGGDEPSPEKKPETDDAKRDAESAKPEAKDGEASMESAPNKAAESSDGDAKASEAGAKDGDGKDEPLAPNAAEQKALEDEAREKAAAAAAKAEGDFRTPPKGEEPPKPFEPAKPKRRDWVMTLGSLAALAGLMSVRGDVVYPRGENPAQPLGHYATLWRSGHVPGGVIWGALLTVIAVVGILGLLGDSPLDLRGDESKPDEGTTLQRKKWYQREGAWLVGFAGLLYLPMAGAYGLWDPWETHYGEVAREILARDDWITLWWGQEGWFMSKPILVFWLGALGMGFGSTFGLPFWRDMGPGGHEWFIRVPICLFAIGAVYAVYKAVSLGWGRRAGLLCGAVLATMPHFMFLSHQSMTDMPFVAPLVVAMAFLISATITDPEKLVTPRRVKIFGKELRISFWHLVVGGILLVALPQVMYLLTRPVMFACPEDTASNCRTILEGSRIGPIQLPIEQYWSGSAGNSVPGDQGSSVPGSPAWEDRYNQVPGLTSLVQGIVWSIIGTILMLTFRRERKEQGLRFAIVYLFSAISFMGKGPAGLGVPEIVLLGFMMTTGKWKLLPRIRFFQGIAIFLLVGFPWYIGIYGRLGSEFTDRFIVHDLLNRAFAGVHGDKGTFRYFVWQLGYAMFPWTGLVPVALGGWRLIVPKDATEAQRDVARLALLWLLVTFTLFSMMVTKFHHYIFPAVPPIAILVGLTLNRMMGDGRLAHTKKGLAAALATFAGVALTVFGIATIYGPWHGRVAPVQEGATTTAQLVSGSPTLGIALALVGVVIVALSFRFANEAEEGYQDAVGAMKGLETPDPMMDPSALPEVPEKERAKFTRGGLAMAAAGAVAMIALVARDIGFGGNSRPQGFERFIHLFVYNYERQWPTRSFDYTPILRGFGVVAVAAAVLLVIHQTRRHGARVMVAVATCFGFWALDKYMIDLSGHWSQRNLFEKYHAVRNTRDVASIGSGEDARYWTDAMVAYQMNWKGENFYTGNHAVMLECGLPLCRERTPDWLRRHRGQRVFFVTEHSRSSSIISQVRTAGGTANAITNEIDNNKFVIIEGRL
ncbi:MAG: glycosyltransferase family 39 protein [Myxococcales bacterium]|nr:glycosyltransferase family 39 protein [Myxococcales bacterium]